MAIPHGISWAGLAAGPAAWAISFMLDYVLVPLQCAHELAPVPWVSGIGIAAAAAGGLLSLQARRSPGESAEPPHAVRTRSFVAGMGVAAAALFGAVMVLQLTAGLMFDGCER